MSTINRVADYTNEIHRDIFFFRFGVNILNRCVHAFYYAEDVAGTLFPLKINCLILLYGFF